MTPSSQPPWFVDAIVYELHVKTFFDGNGDGIGDFAGLLEKLDYLAGLGVTCLWLLPFAPSPLKDDGYDVADYEQVDPRYGTLDDVVRFIEAAHVRGLRVITELVINHTSDQHPWFQAARRAPAGSPVRNFYVWSDTDSRYAGARVIFSDAESSNWTWDPIAGAYYWHRFFHHQPDLNFDSPDVRDAVVRVMRSWLDRGVDGLRLDAIAHLYEREGTACDNLPETHAFLRQLRGEVDRDYPGRVLLAEANSTLDTTRAYFGRGDECQLAFHFPLMPRLFLALAEERASQIADIIVQAAAIPAGCQWVTFLRNHDELTLSAVGSLERERFLEAYAPEPRMRLNHGIRRRLAPLMGFSLERIALATALLLSLPGAPVIYYGDEIGMGDDVDLPDRDGLRTPMQWSPDANGGFSRAPRAALVLPPIADGPGGYPTVNVAEQAGRADSLLEVTRRLIHVRRQHPALGGGSVASLDAANPHVLVLGRRQGEDEVLVVLNLAGSPQRAVIDALVVDTDRVTELITGREASVDRFRRTTTLMPYEYAWYSIAREARERPPGRSRQEAPA